MNNLKIELKWAFIFAIMTLLWMLMEKVSGLHGKHIYYHQYLTNLYAIPAILVMVLALKDKKENFFDGDMTYWQGLRTGLIISIVIALLSPLTQFIISVIISPEFFPNAIKLSLETGHFSNLAEAEAFFNYKNYTMLSAIAAVVMGVVTTAVAMIFLKSKPKALNTAA
jgi:hypothetical protein